MAVARERVAVSQGVAGQADDLSFLPFGGNNAQILAWLDVLLKGKPEQQAIARTEIAMLLEAKGFAEDAEEAYWTNVQARSTDRRSYDRLIELYQQRKDRLSESLVRRQFEEVFDTRPEPRLSGPRPTKRASDRLSASVRQSAPPRPPSPARPSTPARPSSPVEPSIAARLTDNRLPAEARPARASEPGPEPRAAQPSRAALSPADPVRQTNEQPAPVLRLRSASRGPAAATSRSPAARGESDELQLDLPVQRSRAGSGLSDTRRLAASAPVPVQAVPLDERDGGPRAVPVAEILPPMPGRSRRPRRATLNPNPGRRRHAGDGLWMLQPGAIVAFILATVGVAAIVAVVLIFSGRNGIKIPGVSSTVPQRCTDAAQRFPGANDPRGAVVAAYRQQGVDVEAPRAGGPRLTDAQAEQVVGSWMAASLLLERAGQPAPRLVDWLDSDTDRPTLANAILAGRGLDSMLTHEEWSDMRSWPATNCEGAFLRDSRNANLVKLIERVVKK